MEIMLQHQVNLMHKNLTMQILKISNLTFCRDIDTIGENRSLSKQC